MIQRLFTKQMIYYSTISKSRVEEESVVEKVPLATGTCAPHCINVL